MGRRIYIIPKSMSIKDAIEDARLANCGEIVSGVPPVLADVIDEASLPVVFEEAELEPSPEPRDLAAEVDEIKVKIADYDELKARVQGLESKGGS